MTEEQNKPEEHVEEVAAEEASAEAVEETVEQPVEGADEQAGAEEDAMSVLQNELVRAQEDLQQAKETALRAAAEAQNVKRRAQQDVEKAHKFALDKFVESLLPVVDSLENGLKSVESSDGAHDAMREGMELTLKLFVDTLNKHQVEQLNPVGEPLDPNFHQAMTMVPNPDMEPNTVMDVIQKGYTLNGRCVRPAMVVVAKAP
ncbi:nucleotide exchange factor GrpE [Sansalvadorimonas verongulae]|uniref:nucleotide exchange factor GrpE n=1 Tax=Sansalvadorimonas verongulae TaxID=2172824 RepID=UPI0012BCC9F5|nr:nucleotide exchange factor GrpE [Sansalvadorimonas verongulae]MTI15107.1 nucleotide exchange factor GrpE [Sansalvadorimonas verongulae]